MKSTLFLMLIGISFFTDRANAQSTFLNPPNVNCGLKKFDSTQNTWLNGTESDIGTKSFVIEKDYADIGVVGFRVGAQWFSSKKLCIQTATGSAPTLSTTPSANKTNADKWPFDQNFRPMIFSLGYRNTSLTLTNGATSYALGEKWYGIIVGTQHDRKISSRLAFRLAGDLELGMSTVQQESTVTTIAYKNSGVSTFGARGLIGIASQASRKVIFNAETGLLVKYGKYLVPAGYTSITSLHTNVVLGVGIEDRLTSRSGLKFEAGIVGKPSQLFFETGFEVSTP